jgi:uncharacterized protein (TIRG00374 family)
MNRPTDTPPPAINWRKVISRITIIIGIGILVSLLIPVLVSKPVDLNVLVRFHPVYLLLALITGLLPLFLHAWTMTIWGAYFKKEISARDGINIAATSLLGSAVTPTMVGGAPVKLGLLVMYGFRAGQAAAVTSLGSLQDLLAFFALIAASVFISEEAGLSVLTTKLKQASISPGSTALVVAIPLAAVLLFYLLINHTAWGDRIRSILGKSIGDFLDSYKMISRDGKAIFILTMLINILRWLCIYTILVFLLLALKIPEMDYLEAWARQWIVFTGMTVTPLPGGAGGAEAVFYFIYSRMVPEELLVGLVLVWRFFSAYLKIVLAAVLSIAIPIRTAQ